MYTRISFFRQISSPIFVGLLLASSLAAVLDSGIDVKQQPQKQNLNVMAQEQRGRTECHTIIFIGYFRNIYRPQL
jgi:hypothetical protein